MNFRPTVAVVLLAILALTGCATPRTIALPPVRIAYTANHWFKPESPDKTLLNPAQTKALEAWLKDHHDGWTFKVTDTPAGTLVLLEHRDGKQTWLNITPTRIWIGNRYRRLTTEERTQLSQILPTTPKAPR